MADIRKVVLYGNSVFMAGVEASLKSRDEIEVIHIDASLPDAVQELDVLNPAVVIFDLSSPPPLRLGLPFVRDHLGLPFIGLDVTSNTVLVLSCQQYPALTVDDLAQVIQAQLSTPARGVETDGSGAPVRRATQNDVVERLFS
jgi:DNA-binding NarL/FixJ family response regulator